MSHEKRHMIMIFSKKKNTIVDVSSLMIHSSLQKSRLMTWNAVINDFAIKISSVLLISLSWESFESCDLFELFMDLTSVNFHHNISLMSFTAVPLIQLTTCRINILSYLDVGIRTLARRPPLIYHYRMYSHKILSFHSRLQAATYISQLSTDPLLVFQFLVNNGLPKQESYCLSIFCMTYFNSHELYLISRVSECVCVSLGTREYKIEPLLLNDRA